MRTLVFDDIYSSQGILIIIFLLLLSNNSYSQNFTDTLNIESVTIYHKRPIIGAIPGAKIITVDSLTIANKAGQSLADLLQENSSLYIKTYGRGSMASVSMRGTGTSHTKVYWNGIHINSPMTGSVDFSTLPLYFIDEINLHYGQSSMVFGSGGLGGAINLESSTDWNSPLGLKIYQSVGSFSTYSSAIKATYGASSKIRFQTRAFYESSDNNFRYQNTAHISKTNPFERVKNADYKKSGVLQEVYYQSENDFINADLWLSGINRSIPKLMSNYSVDEKNRQNDLALRGVVRWHHLSDFANWAFTSGYYSQGIDYLLMKYPTFSSPQTIVDNKNSSSTFFSNVELIKTSFNWLDFTVGSKLSEDLVSVFDKKTALGYSRNRLDVSLFSDLEVKLIDRLKLNYLIIKQFTSDAQAPILPSLSIEFKPFNKINLILKTSIAKNHNLPSLNDMYWNPGGNPNLKPELSTSYDAGLLFEYSIKNFTGNIELSAYNSTIENWILWLPSFKGSWEPKNIDIVKNNGFELVLATSFCIGSVTLKESGGYSFSKTTNQGNQLPFIPLHSGVLSSVLQINRIQLVHHFSYYSERFTTTSNNPNQLKTLYPYYMNSLSFGYSQKIWKSTANLAVRIDNLLNENYQSILWRPMPGRNYTLNLRIDL